VPIVKGAHALSSYVCKVTFRPLSLEIWGIKFLRNFSLLISRNFFSNLRTLYNAFRRPLRVVKIVVEILSNSTSGLELYDTEICQVWGPLADDFGKRSSIFFMQSVEGIAPYKLLNFCKWQIAGLRDNCHQSCDFWINFGNSTLYGTEGGGQIMTSLGILEEGIHL